MLVGMRREVKGEEKEERTQQSIEMTLEQVQMLLPVNVRLCGKVNVVSPLSYYLKLIVMSQ